MPKNEEQLAILTDTSGGEIALKGVKAHARLQGLLAEVAVEQSYQNPQDTNIEAVYTFPLPFGAVLLGLEVEIAGKKLAGQVVERQEAERRYEDAVTDGDSTVMLEEAGPGLYTASLGNLMANESAVIRYRYGLLLNWQGDRLRFLLPTTIAPRYGDAEAAGLQPHQVPESSLTVEYPLELVVDVEGELASAAIACPSHPIAMERTDTGLRVRLDKKAYLDRDFVLTLASDKVQSSCVVVPDGDRHVALASLRIPPVPEQERQPLALKLVIDCSGSMGGTSIAQARKAGLAILDQLRPGDSFNVTLFGSEFKHFFRKMVPATAQYITEAWNQIDRMDANLGGTEMEKALDTVFALKGESTSGTVLLITDGEIEEHEKLVRRAEQSGQRVFVVGVGTSVAETFLRNLANATHGACELVAPQEGMSELVLSQFHRMRQQRMGKLNIQWPTLNRWQTRLPETVFAGDTVHVFAGFEQAPVGEVRLIIDGGDAVVTAITPLDDPQVPRIAAARRLEELPESEARSLALRHQLLSRWTNFLVIAERADKAEELPELHKVPQMLAAGWSGTGKVMYGYDIRDKCDMSFACIEPREQISPAKKLSGGLLRSVIDGLEGNCGRLRHLFHLGKKRGFVNYEEISDALPIDIADADQIENIVSLCNGMGIRVTDRPQNLLPDDFFDECCTLIEDEYQRLGHKIGWRFLTGPKATFSSDTQYAFISLNPGGSSDPPDHPHESSEKGSAYFIERWKNAAPGQSSLQIQVQRLFERVQQLANYEGPLQSFADSSILSAHFIPFRSPRFADLCSKKESTAFARKLWSKIFAEINPRLVITIDTESYRHLRDLLSKDAISIEEKSFETGWGNISCDVMTIRYGGGKDKVLLRLPHLSTFRLFSRDHCTPYLDTVFEHVKNTLSEKGLKSATHDRS